jgi:serine/threonine protein kinase
LPNPDDGAATNNTAIGRKLVRRAEAPRADEMSLQPGTRLGPYEVSTPIGAGGMGEVYRACDTKLDRDVAIKVLPEASAADPERTARSEREAKTVASSID